MFKGIKYFKCLALISLHEISWNFAQFIYSLKSLRILIFLCKFWLIGVDKA